MKIAPAIPGMSIQDSHANRTSRREVALTDTCHTPGPMVDTFKVVNGNANRTSLRGCEEALTSTTRTPGSTPPVTGHVGSISQMCPPTGTGRTHTSTVTWVTTCLRAGKTH